MTERFEHGPEDPYRRERDWLQDMMERNPHDFESADLAEIQEFDYQLIKKFLADELPMQELQIRQQDLDINHPLSRSQKELNAFLINRLMEKIR